MDMSTLSVLQYNPCKSRNIVMVPFFQNESIFNINIIALQESWGQTRDQITYHLQINIFHLIYPENDKLQGCFFVNKRIKEPT